MWTTRPCTLPWEKPAVPLKILFIFFANCNHDIPWINYGITACSNLFGLTSTLSWLSYYSPYFTNIRGVPNIWGSQPSPIRIYNVIQFLIHAYLSAPWKKYQSALSCFVCNLIFFWTRYLEPDTPNLILATQYLKPFICNIIIATSHF